MPSALSVIFPPAPTFTDKNLLSLKGKVYIITGAASGIGFELAKIIYCAGGTVYIAARSTSRCDGAIQKIKVQTAGSKDVGRLESIVVNLADLSTVKGAVDDFLRRETRLDILVHNAGVMTPPAGSKDTEGRDLEMCTNCLAPYLLTTLLEPILTKTALASAPLSVRIIFTVSMMQLGTPPGGIAFDSHGTPKILPKAMDNYMQSKAGGTFLAARFAKRLNSKGVLSMSVHPGIVGTELQRNMGTVAPFIIKKFLKPAVFGAYSELYAAFSPDLKEENNGGFITAWGRISPLPEEISRALKSEAEGGNGASDKFWEYCGRETSSLM